MFKKTILMLFASLLLSAAVVAHSGHSHIVGTIKTIDGDHVTIQTTKGKDVMIMINNETKFVRKNAKASREDLKVGVRLAVEAGSKKEMKDMLVATKIRFGAAGASNKSK
jgi:Skp family chaperone for outer membrane proteins